MFLDEAQVGTETDSSVVSNLKRAKALIADPKDWLCGSYFHRDIEGQTIARCAFGALAEVLRYDLHSESATALHHDFEESKLLNRAARELYKDWPTNVNDRLGHDAAMKMFDKAIELAERENVR